MEVCGLENYPRQGPALVVFNHLGDPDIVLLIAALPDFPEITPKIELREIKLLRWILDGLGVMWVHRGLPERRIIRAILEAFQQDRRVFFAPEGRESVSGALEEGNGGAAFLVLKAEQPMPIVPITITGSEFRRIENDLKIFRRPTVQVTIGEPFTLPSLPHGREGISRGTQIIMETLARQLPAGYRGFYSYVDRDSAPGDHLPSAI